MTKHPQNEPRDAATKLARQRLSVLELAQMLGNAAEACRQRGMNKSSFYKWKRRYQAHGFQGLKDLPPIHKSHPHTTPVSTVERIKELALAHPTYGCNRIETLLALDGRRLSAVTIQKILNDYGLGTIHARWRALRFIGPQPCKLTAGEIDTILMLIGASRRLREQPSAYNTREPAAPSDS